MLEQIPDNDQNPDEQQEGFFFSVDLLDEVMGSLAGGYTRLWLFEKNKPCPDICLIDSYTGRHNEILLLKESFPIDAADHRNKAIDIYSRELERVRILLEKQGSM